MYIACDVFLLDPPIPMVWSIPLNSVQSKLSLLSWYHPQRLSSKLHESPGQWVNIKLRTWKTHVWSDTMLHNCITVLTSRIKGNISDITVEKANICHFDHCQRTKFYSPGLECQLGNRRKWGENWWEIKRKTYFAHIKSGCRWKVPFIQIIILLDLKVSLITPSPPVVVFSL